MVASRNTHWIVPRPANSLFVGRDKLLQRLKNCLQHDPSSSTTKQRRFVITGLGGFGKSETCLQVANQMREE